MDLNRKILDAKTPADLPDLEKDVIKFWDENKIFEKSLADSKGKKKFTFYDGPPFANGLPHYGHILAMSIKDLFVRYKTMHGFYVPRRNGWDCHGLPVEYQIEKEIGISGKPEIEKYGIDKFNAKARESVFKYVGVWTDVIKRIGRWVDFGNTYATLDPKYIESVWWVFKQLWDKGLVYKGYTSQPYCTRCGTSLSNFETNQGYKDNVKDPSVYIKFRNIESENEYFMAWTTTPWTLPANLALAVGEDVEYGLYIIDNENIWVATSLASKIFEGDAKPTKTVHGRELIGMSYEPLYEQSKHKLNKTEGAENAYKIYGADFVTLEDGTGIVHVAPAYGEDDMALGKKNHLPVIFSCDHSGKMITEIAKSKYIKEADGDIISDLKARNLLYKSGTVRHTYPFCWRCDSPLIYIATSSWFVRVSQIKDQLVDLNEKIKWQPAYLKDGRFGKWLEGARDWNIARQRFWGAPIPIWQCDKCENKKVVSSIEELNQKSGFDPHRPQIDSVEFDCECGGKMHRIPEVFDCWFESGSMPYAQWHYPFENKKEFDEDFPADFIAEGLDQTRGWFYTLHVLSSAVFEEPAYFNVVVNGMILAEDGQKLSKKLRNYPEPSEVFDELGADALRQYLFSATQIGEDYRFSKKLVTEEARKTIYPLWNSLVFYTKFLKESGGEASEEGEALDRWMKERIKETAIAITKYMDDYDLTRASRAVRDLVSDLTLWYLRLSRKRTDVKFKETLQEVLKQISIICAPFMPFISEMIYQNVRGDSDAESVHLEKWRQFDKIDTKLISDVADVRSLVELAYAARAQAGIKVRQPLFALSYRINSNKKLPPALEQILENEINITSIVDDISATHTKIKQENSNYSISIDTTITEELKAQGDAREITRTIQSLRKQVGLMPKDRAEITITGSTETIKNSTEELGNDTNSAVKVSKTEPSNSRAQQKIGIWNGEVVVYLV